MARWPYDRLKGEVSRTLKEATSTSRDYQFDYQYGGHYDGGDRVFVGFNTGARLRNSYTTRQVLARAKATLDPDRRIKATLHYMAVACDYVLIVETESSL